MAPIPSTLDSETKSLIESLERKQRDLFEFQISRLRSCQGPLSTQQDYAAEIREDIEGFARSVEKLDIAVDDQNGEKSRIELRQIVNEFKGALNSLRRESRSALLASKRAIDAQKSSNREELLRSAVVREKQTLGEQVAEDALMKTSNDVTEALQRTIGLMQGELEKSVLSTQLLEASTASLKSASTTHDVLDGLLVTSKHLITALEKSDWLDRLVILAALLFFILVVLFILKQRLVDRSLRIALLWTRFIPSRGKASDVVVDVMEKGSVAAFSTTISTVVAVTTAAVAAAASSSEAAVSIVSSLSSSSPSTSAASISRSPPLAETTISSILEDAVTRPSDEQTSQAEGAAKSTMKPPVDQSWQSKEPSDTAETHSRSSAPKESDTTPVMPKEDATPSPDSAHDEL